MTLTQLKISGWVTLDKSGWVTQYGSTWVSYVEPTSWPKWVRKSCYGPESTVVLSKSYLNSLVHDLVMEIWNERWTHIKDGRQTAIFFEKIDLDKSKGIIKLSKEQISKTV